VELARSSALSHGHRKFTMDDLSWTIFDGQSDQNRETESQRPYTSKLDLRKSSLVFVSLSVVSNGNSPVGESQEAYDD
jgi:hypothetical protein